VLLLTGRPGVGKTTVMRRVASRLRSERPALRLSGFITEEIRERGARTGFRIVPLHGPPRIMAHVDIESRHRVGRYGVDVATIDAVAESALATSGEVALYLVDEIGKMECFSARFVSAMRALLASERRVLATVALRGVGLVAEAKGHPDSAVWEISTSTRDVVTDRILEWIGHR